MPLYHHLSNWSGLQIKVRPLENWRKKVPFWPYFVGQKTRLELVITKPTAIEKTDLQFHIVEKMGEEAKPKIIELILSPQITSEGERTLYLDSGSLITGKGELKYWLSNRGYNVDHDPIFTAEVINLDTFIIPIALMLLGPLLGFLAGLIFGLLISG